MTFNEIKTFSITKQNLALYEIHVDWEGLQSYIDRYSNNFNLDFSPDFQRGYVWDVFQKMSYVEYILKGGMFSKTIYFNHPNWMGSYEGQMVVVDGKQRLKAVMDFLDNKIPAFGYYYTEFTDRLKSHHNFKFCIASLSSKEDILEWYLNINTMGTPHTTEEIKKVENLLHQERMKK